MKNIENPATMWKASKEIMDWKSASSPTLIEVNNVLITRACEIAQFMNEFFINKVNKIRAEMRCLIPNLIGCRKIMQNKTAKISLKFVTVEKVRRLISGLSNSRSVSIDGLDNFAVKVAGPCIAKPLHHIITLSIMHRKFPTNWKIAKIIPLQKNVKLSALDRKNYRPVALLSPLSKILEKVIYEQLYNYFSGNKIFHPSLHGYRKFRSTQTALLELYDKWVHASHTGYFSGSVLLDLSAAFDLVSHKLLLDKLKIYGLHTDFLEWIQSYMSGRYQSVWIDHVYSRCLSCEVGVPQGSNLGPLFFLLFANDLPYQMNFDMVQYTDDSTLTVSGKTIAEIETKIERGCNLVNTWMRENQLKLNAEKTHLLVLGTEQRMNHLDSQLNVLMDGVNLNESEDRNEILLGCWFQSNLKWAKHIKELESKLKKRLVGISYLKYVLPFQERKLVADGLFNSVLSYCLPLFGGCNRNHVRDLQVLQNKVARIVCHAPSFAHRRKLYDHLEWLTVRQLIQYSTLVAVYRMRSSGEPECLAKILNRVNTRGSIIVQNTKLSLFQSSFRIRGASDWNKLPKKLREARNIGQFKKLLKPWIRSNVPFFYD